MQSITVGAHSFKKTYRIGYLDIYLATMVTSSIIIFAFIIAAVSADVSQLSTNLLAPSSALRSSAISAAPQNFDNVAYGVNPFGKNANQVPVKRPLAVATPRVAAQRRAFVSQPSILPSPRPFQSPQRSIPQAPQKRLGQAPVQQFRPQQIVSPQQTQQKRLLPIVDRNLLNEINAQTLRQDQEIYPDGSYEFSFETDNGIVRSESGKPKIVASQPGQPPAVAEQVTGSFSYIENGKQIQVTYIADENGFRAFGDHLPTPPPTPPHVLRTLEILAKLPKIQS